MNNLLVAVSLDREEARLLEYAEKLASDYQAKLWLIHCAAPDPDFVPMEAASTYERDQRAEKLREEHRKLQDMADQFESKGIDTEPLLIQGPTVKTLMAKAEDVKADLILTGLHEHGLLHELFVGHTSLELLKRTKIPVLTVPVED